MLSYGLFVGASAAIFVLLKGQVNETATLNLCLCIAAGFLAYILKVVVSTFLPRRYLPRLQEKAILITGCDTGFGNKLARSLDSLGVTVYATCLLPDGPDAQELKKTSTEKLHILPLDVTKDEDVKAALQYVKATLGDKKLWAVVNNAGIGTASEIEWLPVQVIKNIFEINTFGPVRVTTAFLPLLRESKGRVVNVASAAAYWSIPCMVPYCMSKFAIKAFTHGLGCEMKKFSISTHSIEPFLYSTALVKNGLSSFTDNWNKTSNDIKEAYGMDYIQSCETNLKWLNKLLTNPESSIQVVINDLLDACIGVNPRDSYVPSLIGKLIMIGASLTPSFIHQHIITLATNRQLPPWEK